jgi:hypothetical protein
MMAGEKNLSKMLENLSPVMTEQEYVFCTFTKSSYGDLSDLEPIASVMEDEGLTLVLKKERAIQAGVEYFDTFRCISLGIHSDLTSVGLTAKISSVLYQHGISSNMIAGYFHDHIFVPSDKALNALEVLSGPLK